MSFLDVKDRIPTEVLDNGAVRYGVYDESGNLLRYEYIKREDEPIEEGTAINKVFLNEMYGMDNYEQISLTSQDNIGEATTSNNIVGQIDNLTTGTVWSGHIINKLDTSVWDFNIKSNEHNLALIKSPTTSLTAIALSPYNGGTAYGTLDYLNTALKRTSYDSGSYIVFGTYQKSQKVGMVWDFQVACTPIFHGRGAGDGSSNYYGSANLYGSNNNIDWVNLSAVNGIVNYTVTTPYRYFKLEISLSGGGTGTDSYSQYVLNYAYFTNVADNIPKFRNNFTSINDFNIKECANVTIPTYEYDGYIGENTINNIPVDFILGKNLDYKLRYDGEKIISNTEAKVVTGTYTGQGSETHKIELGFRPSLLIVSSCEDGQGNILGFCVNGLFMGTNSYTSTDKATYNSDYGILSLTDTGFEAVGTSAGSGATIRGFDKTSATYSYIAIRF